jgi:uncharacterized protein (DUF1499 family)
MIGAMLSKLTITLALVSIGLVIGGPLLARTGIAPPMLGMALFALSGLLGLIALLCAAIAAIRCQAYFPAMIGTLGLLPLLAVIATTAQGMRFPAINDITTDLVAPLAFEHAPTLPENAGRDMTFPPEFSVIVKASYSDLGPLPLSLPPERAYQRARDLAEQEPFRWTITRDDAATHTFEAVAETRLFRWKDDIIVRIRPDGADGSLVDMRSKSRNGKSDLGANAKRIRAYFEELAS